MTVKKRGLGRNLNALLGSVEDVYAATKSEVKPESNQEYRKIPVDMIVRSPYQPRREFEPNALEELAQSIRAQGVIQPIVVRKIAQNKFELVAGERRWRASQLAGLHEIPALVKELADDTVMAVALIENIQRENLNPIEEAIAINRLIEELNLTHQQVAETLGKSRTTVTNLLRLLSLREEVKTLLMRGDLEMGHARALLALENDEQVLAAKQVIENNLSVRETEKLIRRMLQHTTETQQAEPAAVAPEVTALQNQIEEILSAKVLLKHNNNGKGQLIIHYNDLEELDGIIAHIN